MNERFGFTECEDVDQSAEITSEMETSGLEVLADYDAGWDNARLTLRRIYSAMIRVRKPSGNPKFV